MNIASNRISLCVRYLFVGSKCAAKPDHAMEGLPQINPIYKCAGMRVIGMKIMERINHWSETKMNEVNKLIWIDVFMDWAVSCEGVLCINCVIYTIYYRKFEFIGKFWLFLGQIWINLCQKWWRVYDYWHYLI